MTEPAEYTQVEQHDAFYQTVLRSEATSRKATELTPEDPTPWCTLVTLARGRGYDNNMFASVWRELQVRDPLHRAGHEFALMYLSPDGPGSYDTLFAFAERAAAASPSLAFLVIQAAYDYEDHNEKIWRDARIHRALDTMLRWLATPAGGGGVYASSDRNWAAYGLVSAGRGAEAVRPVRPVGHRRVRKAVGRLRRQCDRRLRQLPQARLRGRTHLTRKGP